MKIGAKMINARAETLGEKPAFKGLFRKHRLLVPMDGFYEWQAGTGEAQQVGQAGEPMFIHRIDGQPLAVAGLWAAWKQPGSEPDAHWLHSCTVITIGQRDDGTRARSHAHAASRVGVGGMARRRAIRTWRVAALAGAPDDLLEMHAVSTAVNNVRNKAPS
jgi:putative SOS response-associated peptidase YedK